MLLFDEGYVKSSLTYHAGSVFNKAVNKPDSLATTVLSFMLVLHCCKQNFHKWTTLQNDFLLFLFNNDNRKIIF